MNKMRMKTIKTLRGKLIRSSFIKLSVLTSLLLTMGFGSIAHADPVDPFGATKPSLWLNAGFFSYHLQRDRGYRENNYGVGVQADLSPTQSVAAGYYINSLNHDSHYASWIWEPLHVRSIKLGTVVTALDGYPAINKGGFFLAVAPILSFEYQKVGMNILFIPAYQKNSGVIAFQMKFKLF